MKPGFYFYADDKGGVYELAILYPNNTWEGSVDGNFYLFTGPMDVGLICAVAMEQNWQYLGPL